MITKTVQIEFADPTIRAIDYIQDIRKAAEYAGLNLYSRHNVQLQYPMPTPDGRVVVDVRIPDAIAESYPVGYRLRGISNYLLNRCEGRYQKHLVGNRLLRYVEVEETTPPPRELAMVDRLEAISDFAKLLERSDDEACDLIGQILALLKESKTF